jgi:hypothetical protein
MDAFESFSDDSDDEKELTRLRNSNRRAEAKRREGRVRLPKRRGTNVRPWTLLPDWMRTPRDRCSLAPAYVNLVTRLVRSEVGGKPATPDVVADLVLRLAELPPSRVPPRVKQAWRNIHDDSDWERPPDPGLVARIVAERLTLSHVEAEPASVEDPRAYMADVERDTVSSIRYARQGRAVSAPVGVRRLPLTPPRGAGARSRGNTGTTLLTLATEPADQDFGRSSVRLRSVLQLPPPVALEGLVPDWEADDSRATCPLCGVEFIESGSSASVLAAIGVRSRQGGVRSRRRHHCRCCGVIVCGKCSAFGTELEAMGKESGVSRLCGCCTIDVRASGRRVIPFK